MDKVQYGTFDAQSGEPRYKYTECSSLGVVAGRILRPGYPKLWVSYLLKDEDEDLSAFTQLRRAARDLTELVIEDTKTMGIAIDPKISHELVKPLENGALGETVNNRSDWPAEFVDKHQRTQQLRGYYILHGDQGRYVQMFGVCYNEPGVINHLNLVYTTMAFNHPYRATTLFI